MHLIGKKVKNETNATGHQRIWFCNERHLKHRIIWLMMTGSLPKGEIDHIDQNPGNNKWNNLRDVSGVINMRNKTMMSNNTSGFTGVSYDGDNRFRKWRGAVKVNGKRIRKSFATKDEAIAFVKQTRKDAGGFTENHGV